MALAVTSPDFGTLWIDFPRSRYYINRPLSDMPLMPTTVALFSQPISADEEFFPWVQWSPIDPLLWWMSRAALDQAGESPLRNRGRLVLPTRGGAAR